MKTRLHRERQRKEKFKDKQERSRRQSRETISHHGRGVEAETERIVTDTKAIVTVRKIDLLGESLSHLRETETGEIVTNISTLRVKRASVE